MWLNPQFPADFVTFTEEILNGKLPFCAVSVAGHLLASFSGHLLTVLFQYTSYLLLLISINSWIKYPKEIWWSCHRSEFNRLIYPAQKVRISIKEFFSKCDQFRRKLWILSDLLKKSLMKTSLLVDNKH